ncbi:MAG: hypothetical protein WCP92_07920 [bacterium]
MKKFIANIKLFFSVGMLYFLVSLQRYFSVGFIVWVDRFVKIMTYLGISSLLGFEIRIIYGALFASNAPDLSSAIFLCVVAGILIFISLVAFYHRHKVWL